MSAGERARQHLASLAASPRPAGSVAEAAARRYCAETLASLGFHVADAPFEYSTFPGRWATPLAGLGSIGVLAAAGHVGSRGDATAAVAILGAALVVGGLAAVWVARHGVLQVPFGRAVSVNLRAARGTAEPTVWLIAHLDSKSQPIPIAARAVGIIGTTIVWLAAMAVAIGQVAGAPVAGWWSWIVVAGLVAALPVAASVVGARSNGAVDNASGVAAVLLAAEFLDEPRVGVLLTSAEELGLAGARAIGASFRPSVALNCDTVDDGAPMLCLTAGARGRAAGALRSAGRELGVGIQTRRLLPGILVDAVALADAGWDCATLSAASWATLRRVHTSRDNIEALRGDGVAVAGEVLAGAARDIVRNPEGRVPL